MLNPECERFQSHYERGERGEHWASCAECQRFVDFVDGLQALGVNPPLEDSLRSRLRRVPLQQEGLSPLPRLPELPLPDTLRLRLRSIARDQGVAALPIWVRSPRYAIAASYLLTLLFAGTIGNPAAWASQAEARLERVGQALRTVQSGSQEAINGLGEVATENYSLTRDFLRESSTTLRASWFDLVETLREPSEAEAPPSDDNTPEEGRDG